MVLLILLIVPFLVPAKPPVEYELLRRFLDTRDVYTAYFLLDRFRDAVFVDELRIELAWDLLKRGDREEALRVAKHVNLERVRDLYASKVYDIWTNLPLDPKPFLLRFPEKAIHLLGRVKITEEEKEKVLSRLITKKLYREVIRFSGDNCFYKTVALYRLGRYREAVKLARECKDRRSWRYGVISLIRLGDLGGAKRFAIRKDDPDLYFLIGWEFLMRGDLKKARRFIDMSGENLRRYFYSALVRYVEGRYRLAYEILSEGEKVARGSIDRARIYFWKFKVLKAMGDDVMAHYYLAKAAEEEGFYGAVAKRILGEKVHRGSAIRARDGDPPLWLSRLIRIAEAGFPYYLRLEILKMEGQISPWDLPLISRLDPHAAIRIAARRFGVGSEVYRAVAFPTPYREIVRRAAKRFGVDEALVYAIIRQESLFDPFIVSRSDAKGLMQLIDPTARWIARRIGIVPKDIFDPETNVTLGVAYLSYLMEMWNGDMLRVLASYNAGPNAVGSWRRIEDDFLFIELIPYGETRKYVKRVLWYYYVYKEILSEKGL